MTFQRLFLTFSPPKTRIQIWVADSSVVLHRKFKKKICFSLQRANLAMQVQVWFSPPGTVWALFRPRRPHPKGPIWKPFRAHAVTLLSPWVQIGSRSLDSICLDWRSQIREKIELYYILLTETAPFLRLKHIFLMYSQGRTVLLKK